MKHFIAVAFALLPFNTFASVDCSNLAGTYVSIKDNFTVKIEKASDSGVKISQGPLGASSPWERTLITDGIHRRVYLAGNNVMAVLAICHGDRLVETYMDYVQASPKDLDFLTYVYSYKIDPTGESLHFMREDHGPNGTVESLQRNMILKRSNQ